MAADSGQKSSKPAAGTMPAPFCVHVYVWAFMVTLGIAPILGPSLESIAHGAILTPLLKIALMQYCLLSVQRLCSTEELSYWDGLLAAACSVTTRGFVTSFVRVVWLLLGVLILSVLYAACHDRRSTQRHAGLRYGRLIVWLHQQRLRP